MPTLRRVRARIETVFGTCKRCYGLRRMRWLGLAKAGLQVRPARRRSRMRAAPGLSPPQAGAPPDRVDQRRRNIRRLPNAVDNAKESSIRNKSLIRAQVS
jgi:hypothetical protein